MVLSLCLVALRLWPHAHLRDSLPRSIALYAKNGELLRLTTAVDGQYRLWVPLTEIDPRLVEAVQLYEDKWFGWHIGINPIALIRAGFATYHGKVRQGGSTITMQLARRLYRIHSQTLGGKLKQLAVAMWLEARYSKHEILEAYLNLAPYGANIEGVGAASLIYFHKRAQQLTLPEVLMLAVIPQNPRKRGATREQYISPYLLTAREHLWRRWLKRYPDAINYRAEIQFASKVFLRSQLPFRAPHFTDSLLRKGISGEVLTTLDMRVQSTAERLLAQYLDNVRNTGINNAAVLLLDRDSGAVRALIGSSDYFNQNISGQVNGVAAKRSPGSTLKPFIYGLALDQGLLHPLTILKDMPTTFGPFSPENFDGHFLGPITAQDALVRSRNVPAVALAAKLTRPTLYEFLQQAGVTKLASEQRYGLTLALGGGELTMEELARLYLMLANKGVALPLHYHQSQQDREKGGAVNGSCPRKPHLLLCKC